MNKILIQIDNTIMDAAGNPVKNMVELVRGLQTNGGRVIFMTRQPESKRPELLQWILKHMGRAFENVALYMPNDNDNRPEAAIVVEWVNDIKKSKNVVLAAIEGRTDPAVLNMWQAMNITCLQMLGGKK